MLSEKELQNILTGIHNNWQVIPGAEIPLEANPDDISEKMLVAWKNAGINRLSIGIQSFYEKDLRWMNRAHNSTQAIECIQLARQAGISNFSIDLIFGIPGLTNSEWINNVQTVLDLEVPHIACYALTVEPNTALYKMIQLKKKENVNNDVQAEQFTILMEMMRRAGYEHYEISNFARPGFRSQHNSSYWKGEKYLGLGPSAHSYTGTKRLWNVANNSLYLKSVKNNVVPFEAETLTTDQKLQEYIMISLRTIEGMDLQYIEEAFSPVERKRMELIVEEELAEHNLYRKVNHIILTDQGKLLADAISVKFFK